MLGMEHRVDGFFHVFSRRPGQGTLNTDNIFFKVQCHGHMEFHSRTRSIKLDHDVQIDDVQLSCGSMVVLFAFTRQMVTCLQQGQFPRWEETRDNLAQQGQWTAVSTLYSVVTGGSLGYAFRFGNMMQQLVEVHGQGLEAEEEEKRIKEILSSWVHREGFAQVAQALFLFAPLLAVQLCVVGQCLAHDPKQNQRDFSRSNKD